MFREALNLVTLPVIYHCEPAWQWSPPPLEDFDFWAVLSGRGELRLNGKNHALCAGSAFLLRPGDRVEAGHDPPHPLRVVAFHFLPGRGFPWEVECLPHHRLLADLSALHFHAHQALRHSGRTGPSGALRARLAALELLAVLADPADEAPRSAEERLRSVAEFMRSAPAQVESVAALSRQAGMSPAHFSRTFKRLFGETPVHFWNRSRADRAASLLVETTLPLSVIADMLGYADVYHFSKQFGRFRGKPPGAWRVSRG